MSISDDILMAYADGELSPEERATVENAMAQDPTMAAKVAQHQAFRLSIHAAFAPILEEEIPAQLSLNKMKPVLEASTQETDQSSAPKIMTLDSARKQREESKEKERDRSAEKSRLKQLGWKDWGGLAAMLMVGVFLGQSALFQHDSSSLVSFNQDGQLSASGKLAVALNTQLSSDKNNSSGVKIGLSFQAKEGHYCRSFVTKQASGLACHENSRWTIPLIVDSSGGAPTSQQTEEYRQAGSEISPLILELVDQKIAGHSFNEKEEKAALAKAWR